MFFSGISSNIPTYPADYTSTRERNPGTIGEAASSDKNAGQYPSVPYLAEIRGLGGPQDQATDSTGKVEDPLGRGAVLDFVA